MKQRDGHGVVRVRQRVPMPMQAIRVALRRAVGVVVEAWPQTYVAYLELVYLVTALVPSDTACFANSPGSSRRTAVWISRLVMVERLL